MSAGIENGHGDVPVVFLRFGFCRRHHSFRALQGDVLRIAKHIGLLFKLVWMRTREYNVMRLRSWEEYLSIISDSPYQNWAFRGQRDASAPLYSALSRHFIAFRIDQRAWSDQEERILRVFKRKAIHFLDHVPDKDDDFEWLALMQDHGAPTRLLDFSWSPYVAAFFALHNTTEEGVIWACNPVEIVKRELDLKTPGSFRKHFLGNKKPFAWLGEPRAMNRRLIAQSGTFLVPGILH